MRKLLSANLNRLLINRAFWLTVLFMVCAEVFFCLILRRDTMSMDVILFVTLQFISILAAIFFSLFLGTEYSDGTIRNKLIVGHKRSSIYLASLITGIIAVTIIFLAEVLTGNIIGIMLYAAPQKSISQIVLAGVIGWLACISFVSIFNLIGMLSSSKALTSIICLLTAFALLFSGLYIFQLLAKPDFLFGVKREIYQILFEINPSGQILQTMMIDIASPWKLAVYSLLLSFAITGLGLCFFRKKDLK